MKAFRWTMVAGLVAVGMALGGSATAKDRQLKTEAPKMFTDLLQCRSITDAAQRLACYDRSAATLATAQQNNDLYVADKETMRETRRGLFGFNLPKVKLFGNDDIAEDVKSIETTITAVSSGQRGYIFTLEDGARWAQTDGAYMDRPKAGSKIRIRRAALGSYMASVEGRVGFRIERLNN